MDAGTDAYTRWNTFVLSSRSSSTLTETDFDPDRFWQLVEDAFYTDNPTGEHCQRLATLFRARLVIDAKLGNDSTEVLRIYADMFRELCERATGTIAFRDVVLARLEDDGNRAVDAAVREILGY